MAHSVFGLLAPVLSAVAFVAFVCFPMGKRKAETTSAGTDFAGSDFFHGFSWHSGDPKVLAEGRL
jgi:hypothetical protein